VAWSDLRGGRGFVQSARGETGAGKQGYCQTRVGVRGAAIAVAQVSQVGYNIRVPPLTNVSTDRGLFPEERLMLRRAWVGVLLVFASLASPAFGQGATKLQWKFTEGDKFYVEDVSSMKQKLEFMGNKTEQSMKTTMITSYTVKKSGGGTGGTDGAVLLQKIEAVTVKSEAGLGGDLDKVMEKLKGATFTITLGPAGKITKFEGYTEFIKNLTEGMEEVGKFVKLLITEDVLKKSAEEAFGFLPPMEVSKGDTWKRESVLPFGPLGSFKAANDYTFQGTEDGLAKIGLKADLRYTPPKGDAGFGLFKISKGNLKSEAARGTLYFDPAKGRLARYNMAMVFRGSLTLDIMGNMVDMEVFIDQSSNSRVLNRNPLQDEKKSD
jgi:hypothetical protein